MLFPEIFHTRFTFGTPLLETILIGKAIKLDVVVQSCLARTCWLSYVWNLDIFTCRACFKR